MRNFLIFCATVAVVAAAPQFSLTGSGFGLGGGYLGMSSLLGGHADTAALDAATVAAFRNALISQLSSATQGSAADRQAVIAALQSGQLNSLLANIINGGIGAQAGSGAGGANQGGSSAGAGQTASGVASTLLDLARRLESSTMASMRALATKFRQLASALGGAVSGAAGSAGSSTGAAGGSGSSGGSTAGGAEAGTGGAAGGSASAGGAAGGSASAGGGAGGSVGIGGGGLSIGASV